MMFKFLCNTGDKFMFQTVVTPLTTLGDFAGHQVAQDFLH